MAEYWRWKEYRWHDEAKDWRKGELITAGVDVGSVSSQAVVVVDGELYAFSNMRTGSNSPESATKSMAWALEDTGLTLDEIEHHLAEGQFPPGSMGPKIESAVSFLASGGQSVVITSPEHILAALAGDRGTTIIPA